MLLGVGKGGNGGDGGYVYQKSVTNQAGAYNTGRTVCLLLTLPAYIAKLLACCLEDESVR